MESINRNTFLDKVCRRQFLKGAGAVSACFIGAGAQGNLKKYGPRTESPARFYKKVGDGKIQCRQCYRICVLSDGKSGYCGVRINRGGELFTLSYGNPGAMNVDPVEKKPFSHVLPGTTAFSIAEVGCNIDCKFCQNWQIAQTTPGKLRTWSMPPKNIAEQARMQKCATIAYTYSEPVVWSEYVIDCARAGKKMGIPSLVISNGTWMEPVLTELLKEVIAVKIDLKSIRKSYYRDVCKGHLRPVLENLERVKKSGVWLEIVNLVVPTLNDSEEDIREMATWIKSHLGPDVPLHFTRFHPMYKLTELPPTPVSILERARNIAMGSGLNYVYIGNVPSHDGEHTYCPRCKNLLIRREGYSVSIKGMKDGKCLSCGLEIPGVWSV